MYSISTRTSRNLKELQLKINMPRTTTEVPAKNNFEYKDKIKVLCLHGYRQNADSFKSKIGSFRKCVNKYAEFSFVSAPLVSPPIDENSEINEEQKSWWFNKENGTFKGTNENGPAIGFEKSLKLVEEAWESDNYQGLLGFSQGACFIGLICSLSEKSLTKIKPNFVILASGFKSKSLAHMNLYQEPIKTPSLHIYGESDEIIPSNLSIELLECFDESTRTVLKHSGGHYFPASVQQKQAYINYFQDRLQDYLEKKVLEEDFEKSNKISSD